MSFFAQSLPSRPCYVLLDGQNRPVVLAGGVTRTATGGRPGAPVPICGLDIDNTSLGRGHIMALELGGPDVSENIVPQYQQWQQTGAWRQMEVRAEQTALPQAIFVALLEYGNPGNADTAGLHATFRDVDPTVYWDDHRVPTRFRIWMLPGNAGPGAQILTTILGAGLQEHVRAAAASVGRLSVLLGTTPEFADFTVTAMPEEDLTFWRRDGLAKVVVAKFTDYKMDFATQTTPSSPYRESEVEYIMGHGDEIRLDLKNDGWSQHELNQYGTNTNFLEAVYHQRPLRAGQNKIIQTRMDAYVQQQLAMQPKHSGKAPTLLQKKGLQRKAKANPYIPII
jgi:hypothetical protein